MKKNASKLGPESFKQLAELLAAMETGKKQVDIAQIYEVLARLKWIFKEFPIQTIKVFSK